MNREGGQTVLVVVVERPRARLRGANGAVELVDIEEFPTNYAEKHTIIVISLSILSRTDSVLFQCNVSVSNGSTNTTVSKKKSDAYQSL